MWLLQKIKKIQISIKGKIRITKSVSTPIPIPQNLKLEVATRRPKVSNISDIKLSYETDHQDANFKGNIQELHIQHLASFLDQKE